jgi:hypothetical protein
MSASYQLFFPIFPSDSGTPRRPEADVLYFGKEQSLSVPKRFLEFLYLTKISYRKNHESGAFSASECLSPCPCSYQSSATQDPLPVPYWIPWKETHLTIRHWALLVTEKPRHISPLEMLNPEL